MYHDRRDGGGMSGVVWIAADWGNTNLRLWALGPDNVVLAEREVARGLSGLAPEEWEPLLLVACSDLLPSGRETPVWICGAAGSHGGWAAAPYRTVPCAPNGGGEAMPAPVRDPRLSVHILPGLKQPSPPAVMRSEETQIAGFLSKEPNFDGVICLPGTHTKWAHISAGEVVSFMSVMTGELFGLLAGQSILRRTIAGEGNNEAAFLDGVEAGMRNPERLTSALISLRAEALLTGLDPVSGRSRLSGLLVGADLVAARYYWLGRDVVVIGADPIAGQFATALGVQGVVARVESGKSASLAGLIAAYEAGA